MTQAQNSYFNSRKRIIDSYLDDIFMCLRRDYAFQLEDIEIDYVLLKKHLFDLYLYDDNIDFNRQLSTIDRTFFPYVSGVALRLYESIEARYETSEISDEIMDRATNLTLEEYGNRVSYKNPYIIRQSLVRLLDSYKYDRQNIDFYRFSSEIFNGNLDVAQYFFECVLKRTELALSTIRD